MHRYIHSILHRFKAFQFLLIRASSQQGGNPKKELCFNYLAYLLYVLLIPGPRCLRFYYHMLGSGMVTAELYVYSASGKLHFEANGDQGDNWKLAEANIDYSSNDQVRISEISLSTLTLIVDQSISNEIKVVFISLSSLTVS